MDNETLIKKLDEFGNETLTVSEIIEVACDACEKDARAYGTVLEIAHEKQNNLLDKIRNLYGEIALNSNQVQLS